MGESGGEGFRRAPELIFDFESLPFFDFGLAIFLPGADQFFQGRIGFVVENLRLVAEGLVLAVELGDGFWETSPFQSDRPFSEIAAFATIRAVRTQLIAPLRSFPAGQFCKITSAKFFAAWLIA